MSDTWDDRWEKKLPELMNTLFPPRVVRELNRVVIQIPEKEVKSIVENQQGFYLDGPTGVGKTLYASALLLATIKYYKKNLKINPSTAFISVTELLEQIKRTFQETEPNDVIDEYCNVSLLLLDDLGVSKVSEWVLQTMDYIINSRYENLKPTIITSNFNLDHLVERFNERLASRIYEMCTQKHFKEKNYRIHREG